MKKIRKWLASPAVTVFLFVAAAGLLLFATIGAAFAAGLIKSQTYKGHVEVYDIGVSLMEKSAHDEEARRVAYRDYVKNSADEWDETPGTVGVLLENLLDHTTDDKGKINYTEAILPGKAYTEEISVKNTGTIDQYVRLTVYKYWTDPDGNKVFTAAEGKSAKGNTTQGLSPDLIHLEYVNQDDGTGKGDWIRDTMASTETEERTVFYYNKLLKSGEDTTKTPLTSTLTIDPMVATKATQKTVETSEEGYKIIRTTFDYDGWRFNIEVRVDAVQDHNAVDAIKSAWGRDVSFDTDGTMKLGKSSASGDKSGE
ncbi:MAG: hypothetical protein Q4D81_08285, partial [Eubacteriales bacterium]|nr:hypothetical protein [Eubacteriales bacterium]